MPIPFILAAGAAIGLGVATKAVTNNMKNKANKNLKKARDIYDNARNSLESAIEECRESLIDLGKEKKYILENSINNFVFYAEKIKSIDLTQAKGLDDISNFRFSNNDAKEIMQIKKEFEEAFHETILGKLAISSVSGSFAAPVLGILGFLKLQENIEKSEAEYAKAEAAAEEMENARIVCKAISEKALMFNSLLIDLSIIFEPCVEKMSEIIENKRWISHLKTSDFSQNELKLFASTFAIAKAIKQVITTQILTKEGEISQESQKVLNEVRRKLPALENQYYDIC